MTKDQLNIILDKIKGNLDQSDFETDSDGLVRKIKSRFPNGNVEVNFFYGKFNVQIKPLGADINYGELKFKYSFPIVYLFYSSWWKWRMICNKVESESKRKQKQDLKNHVKWEKESIDKAIIETFPEVLEDQIFGD